MQIKISDLRIACEKVFAHLEKNGHQSVEIPYDYYWNIPEKLRYDVSRDIDIQELDIGQLTDDWESLQAIINTDSPPINYALVWLSEIFKVIGERIEE